MASDLANLNGSLCARLSGYDGSSREYDVVCNGGMDPPRGRYVVIQLEGVAGELGVCEAQVTSTFVSVGGVISFLPAVWSDRPIAYYTSELI